MPTYDFLNVETGDVFTKRMSYSEKQEYLDNNPHVISQILSAPQTVRGSSTHGIKNDDGWNENLARIAEAHPNSALANKVGGKSSKQVKSKEIAEKHGFGKSGSYADGL